jgi:prepilin-type N-terminal cleavage/methylation domain-containing protein
MREVAQRRGANHASILGVRHGRTVGTFRHSRAAPFLRLPRAGDGFTLVELVVALALLTLGATGLMYMSTISTSGNTRGKDDATAVALAIERMENLKNRGYNALPSSTDPVPDGTFTADGAASGIYTRVYQVSAPIVVAGIPARVIDVWVSWTGGGYVALSTMIVQPTTPVTGMPLVAVRSWNQIR